MKRRLDLGCTAARHAVIGIDAVVNARGGEQWRNDQTIEAIEIIRDGRAIKSWLSSRIRFYGFNSRFFRKHAGKMTYMLSDRD